MASFRFQCESCGLSFSLNLPASKGSSPAPCESCGEMADREVPRGISTLVEASGESMGPGSTGFSAFDHDADRVLGMQARERWENITERVESKKRQMASQGVRGNQLSRNLDGSYRSMSEREAVALEGRRKLLQEIRSSVLRSSR